MLEQEPGPNNQGGAESESSPEGAPAPGSSFVSEIGDLMDAVEAKKPSPEDEARPILKQVQGDFVSLTQSEPTDHVLITPLGSLKDPTRELILRELGIDPEKNSPFGGDLMPGTRLSVPEAKDCRIFSVRTPDRKDTGVLFFTRPEGADAIIATDPRKLKERTFEGGDELLRSTAGLIAKAVAETSKFPDRREHQIRG